MSKHQHLSIPPWMIPDKKPGAPAQIPLPAPPPIPPEWEPRNSGRDNRSERGSIIININGDDEEDGDNRDDRRPSSDDEGSWSYKF